MKILGSTTFGTEERQSRDYYATDPNALVDFLMQFYEDGEFLNSQKNMGACLR